MEMAVNGITGSNSILLSALGSQEGTTVRPIPLQPGNVSPAPLTNTPTAAPAAQATIPGADAIQQNILSINDALRNLGVTPAVPSENLLSDTRSPLLTVLSETQTLTPLQQSALQVNDTLQNLNFVPPAPDNILLVNETSPALEASGVLAQPNQTQGNALLVNQTLTEVGLATSASATPQPVTPAVAVAVTAAATATTVAATAVAQTAPAAGLAATPTPTTATTATTAATVPVEATFLTPDLTPATLSLTLFPDRTPYTLVVYQVNDQAPLPRPPEPISKEVVPIPAVTAIRPTGETRLRQLLQRARESERRRNVENKHSPDQRRAGGKIHPRHDLFRSMRTWPPMVCPFTLFLRRMKTDFPWISTTVPIARHASCRMNVPIPAGNLSGVLGNLQHETGIIVDTKL